MEIDLNTLTARMNLEITIPQFVFGQRGNKAIQKFAEIHQRLLDGPRNSCQYRREQSSPMN
jgi:hypothetical protein